MVVAFGCEAPSIMMVSAVIRSIGNGYKLIKIIGGRLMDTLETKFNSIHQIDFVMETLLVVGNLGLQANLRLRTGQIVPPETITH